ncbi:MAG: hypothetical protein ACK4QW_15805 [Alphaproteobacteria bacterium]
MDGTIGHKHPRGAVRGSRLPATLIIGAAVILAAGALMLADAGMRGWAVMPRDPIPPPQGWFGSLARAVANDVTPIFWAAYILLLDGLLVRLRGGSPARERPRRFVLCCLASIPIWVVFDWINFDFMHAWAYHGLADNFWHRNLGYAVAFAAITPGMLMTAEVLRAVGFPEVRLRPIRIGPTGRMLMVVAGGAALIFPIWIADPIGSLTLWLSFWLVLDPINHRFGAPSLIGDWSEGRWGRTLALAAGGGICGLWWESWNWFATTKWTYDLPFLGPLEAWAYFEMPLIGFLGFLPFGPECWVMFNSCVLLASRLGLRGVEPPADRRSCV